MLGSYWVITDHFVGRKMIQGKSRREKLFGVDVFAIRKPTIGKAIWNQIV